MADVNRLCAPIYVYQEDVSKNAVSAQRERDRLRELSRAPITCLVGTMSSLCEMASSLPVLPWPYRPEQISREEENVRPVYTAEDKTKKSPDISCKSTVTSEKNMADMPKMLELYRCPLLGDAPVTLPHHTSYSAIVTRVVQAQHHLVHKPHLKAEFQNILSSPTIECFVISSFWWLFLHNFQPDRKTQDLLFHTIAENYIRILTENLSSWSGRAFLQAFPSTLSQMLYCSFCTCFPQSCSLHEHAFLSTLCSTAYQWIGGIRPAPEVYQDWDLEALQVEEAAPVSGQGRGEEHEGSSLSVLDSVFPSASLSKPSIYSECDSLTAIQAKKSKCVNEMSQTSVIHSKSKTTPTSQTNIHEGKKINSKNITVSDMKALTDPPSHRSARESGVRDRRWEPRRSVFNVWGNSPLVQYCMVTRGLGRPAGHPVLVQWSEIHKEPPADSLPYRDVVKQAMQHSSSHKRALHSIRAHYAHEIRDLRQKHLIEQMELDRKHKKILSQRSLRRRLCQLLLPIAKSEEEKKWRTEQLRAFEMVIAGME